MERADLYVGILGGRRAWGLKYHRATADAPGQWEQLRPIFDGAYPVGVVGFVVSLCCLGYAFFGTSTKYASNAHGTAEFGTGAELMLLVDKINYLADPDFRRSGTKPMFDQNPMYA